MPVPVVVVVVTQLCRRSYSELMAAERCTQTQTYGNLTNPTGETRRREERGAYYEPAARRLVSAGGGYRRVCGVALFFFSASSGVWLYELKSRPNALLLLFLFSFLPCFSWPELEMRKM